MKALANRDFCKKKLDTRFDTHCIKTGVQLWWKCSEGHEWHTLISTRSGGSKCPYCSGLILLKGFNDFATRQPRLAEEWSDRNLPLMPDMVNEKSRKNVWWKCKVCGFEWKSLVQSRIKGTVCPVCADRAVLPGYNDLATTDGQLLSEWDYEKNEKLTPADISRNSMKSVWWKCSLGHSWKAKIYERAVEETGCPVCEQEYRSVFPQLAVMYYAGKKGLRVRLNTDMEIGLPLETYIVNERLAIESGDLSEEKEKLKAYICRKQDIKFLKLPYKAKETEIEYIRKIKQAFRSVHIFISTNEEEDTAYIRKCFTEWRKNT